MKYKSDDLYNYEQKSWWVFEIFKDICKRSKDSNYKTYFKNNWIEFHPFKWGIHTTLQEAGYFDERPQLQFYLSQLLGLVLIPVLILNFSWWLLILTFVTFFVGIGEMFLCLPYKTGIENCESKQWGFYWYGHEGFDSGNFVLCLGDKSKYIKMPWNLEWYRTSYLESWGVNQPMIWLTEKKGDRKDYWDSEKWKDKFWNETHPYTYVLESGEVQNRLANIKVKEMEWRRRWLMWTTLFNRVIRSIDVEFNGEVGERTGSWKGGTIGCGYEIRPNESPYQCLKRMEQERKF